MKTKKMISIILSFAILAGLFISTGSTDVVEAGARLKLAKKKVTVNVNESVKVKYASAKKAKTVSKDKKIAKAKVIKKNIVITGMKAGKTSVTVKAAGKKINLKVTVVDREKDYKVNMDPVSLGNDQMTSATPDTNVRPSAAPGGIVYCGKLIFEKVEDKDDDYVYVHFSKKDENCFNLLIRSDVKYLVVEMTKEVFYRCSRPLNPGDTASFIYNVLSGEERKQEVKDDTLYMTGYRIVSVINENHNYVPDYTLPPTPAPVDDRLQTSGGTHDALATSATGGTPLPKSVTPVAHVNLSDESLMIIEDGVGVKHNDDGSVTLSFSGQYDGVSFFLPKFARDVYSSYKFVTVRYESNMDLCDMLYDGFRQYEGYAKDNDCSETGMHPNFNQRITAAPNGNKVTFKVGEDFEDDCIRGIQVFNPHETGYKPEITIKDIYFSITCSLQDENISHDPAFPHGDHMPGEIVVGFNEPVDEKTVIDLLGGEETEIVKDLYKSFYDSHKNGENVNTENLEKLKERFGLEYCIFLADKSDETLFNTIAVLKASTLVKYAEVNAVVELID